ncbi:hypothetical protein ACLB2K_065475 [Fragaria x ananassa]
MAYSHKESMSQILSWNCQGLGRALTVQKLGELIRSHSPSVVFLCETKQSNFRVNRLRRQFKFYKGETVLPSRISAGGLAIWWHPEVDVESISRSQNLIDTVIKFSSVDAPTRVTFFYGPPYNEDKLPFWFSIENPAFSNPSAWVCIGDFNEIASMDEKEGGVSWSWRRTRFLRNFMDNNGLLDLHFTSPRLTWENRREDVNEIIRESLDRAIGNAEWLRDWPKYFVKHEPRIGPISLCNSSIKIISKLLANRLKPLLPQLNSEHQNAFVPGRQIQDNLVLAHEAYHYLKLKKYKVNHEFALKLDMNKAYNRVEWDFLEAALLKFGFCSD